MKAAPKAPKLSYDPSGTPAVWAPSVAQAYLGIGYLHAKHRPVQTLLLSAAGRGRLAELLVSRDQLVAIDTLVQRLDLVRRAQAQAEQLRGDAATWCDAYLEGVACGLAQAGQPWELRLLFARLPLPDRVSLLSGLMLSAYLGLAEGQERMEQALVELLRAGARPELLASMFAPHLDGWQPQRLASLRMPQPLTPSPLAVCSGSNAWAAAPERTTGGASILCGDPHLHVGQLPALFFEVRVRLPDGYWLGATIPGLPGIAVGRSAKVAWSGTFGVADNVDWTIEEIRDGRSLRPDGTAAVVVREAVVRRRGRKALRLQLIETDRGARCAPADVGNADVPVSRWAGAQKAAAALAAHMELPLAKSAKEAERILSGAGVFSLHFVLADKHEVRYCQAGRIPRRTAGWSGLYPVFGSQDALWRGYYEGETLPRAPAALGVVASANEARPAADGVALATLAQPDYRLRRIEEVLNQRPLHDVRSMQALQQDRLSLQAQRLLPHLSRALLAGPLADALGQWDFCYDTDSVGAHAFELAYRAALHGLGEHLGGEVFLHLLANSELGTWWCAAFDRLLASEESWRGELGASLCRALRQASGVEPRPWGEVQQVTLRHLVLGGLPRFFRLDRGPFDLPGSRATVQQGNVYQVQGNDNATAPAYRFVCDLGAEGAWTTLPGGIDGSCWQSSYDIWLSEWRAGHYHYLRPPDEEEARL